MCFATERLSDDELETAQKALSAGIEEQFTKQRLYAGPKGLLLLKNCESVRFESVSVGEIPVERQEVVAVPVTLSFRGGTKTDSVEGKATLKIKARAAVSEPVAPARVFELRDVDISPEALSRVDHCKDMRLNSRLFASVQAREIVVGMPEAGVRASWGEWTKKSPTREGVTVLKYPGREVRLRGGLVESWSLAEPK